MWSRLWLFINHYTRWLIVIAHLVRLAGIPAISKAERVVFLNSIFTLQDFKLSAQAQKSISPQSRFSLPGPLVTGFLGAGSQFIAVKVVGIVKHWAILIVLRCSFSLMTLFLLNIVMISDSSKSFQVIWLCMKERQGIQLTWNWINISPEPIDL